MNTEAVNIIVNLISSVGFPIVCVFFLWKYVTEMMQEYSGNLKEIAGTLSKVCDRLDDLERRLEKYDSMG